MHSRNMVQTIAAVYHSRIFLFYIKKGITAETGGMGLEEDVL